MGEDTGNRYIKGRIIILMPQGVKFICFFFNISKFKNCAKLSSIDYIYICGDFNIDLLKLDKIHNYQQYYNLLCSFGFLPLIVQPARVVENQTPSVLDNIFCNNLSADIISGNIYLTLSEHFCQREKIDIKNIDMYSRDYTEFSSKDFIDVSIQTWNYDLDSPSDLFNDFFWRLEGCVDMLQ